jgi:tetratricopeptide (TPR) repeat protein
MELGDVKAASALRERIKGADLFDTARKALGLAAGGKFPEELELLERELRTGTESGRFVHAAALLALALEEPQRALDFIQQRFPTLMADEPINVLNFALALDLALAWQNTGNTDKADWLLKRVVAYLESPSVPKLPFFLVAKAQAFALQGALDQAMTTLEQAYDAGFRTTWAVLGATRPGQLNPYPVEIDPRFGALHDDPRFSAWLSRIKDDNAAQAAALKERLAAPPAN